MIRFLLDKTAVLRQYCKYKTHSGPRTVTTADIFMPKLRLYALFLGIRQVLIAELSGSREARALCGRCKSSAFLLPDNKTTGGVL